MSRPLPNIWRKSIPTFINCLGCDLSKSYIYAAVAGFFLGAAVVRLIRGPVRGRDRRDGLSALVPVYLSIVLLSILGGFFLGGGYPDAAVAFSFAVPLLLTVLAGLFRRAGGIAVFLFLVFLFITLGFSLREWNCSPGGTLLQVRFLSETDDGMRLQVERYGKPAWNVETESREIRLRADVLNVHPAWFFINSPVFFRIYNWEYPSEQGVAGASVFDRLILFLPGIHRVSYESEEFTLEEFVTYTLYYGQESGFQITTNFSDAPMVLTNQGTNE